MLCRVTDLYKMGLGFSRYLLEAIRYLICKVSSTDFPASVYDIMELYEHLFYFVFFVLRIYLFTVLAVELATYIFKITRKQSKKKLIKSKLSVKSVKSYVPNKKIYK